MKRWQGSCIGAILVLLIGGASLFFFVPFGGAMIAAMVGARLVKPSTTRIG